MPLTHLDALVVVVFCGCLVLIHWYTQPASRRFPLPPGPPRHFVDSSKDASPRSQEWLAYTDMGRQFGEITYLQIVKQPVIVLNSFRVASELLEKRGSNYSSRPKLPAAVDLSGFGDSLAQRQNTPVFRAHRRLFEQQFRASVIPKYQQTQIRVAYKLMQSLVDAPEKFSDALYLAGSSMIMGIVYGYEPTSIEDEWIRRSKEGVAAFRECMRPGAWLIDYIPILKHIPPWFPGAGFKRRAIQFATRHGGFRNYQFSSTRARMESQVGKTCIVSELLDELESGGNVTEDGIRDIARSAFGAGVETTVATLRSFILQMTTRSDIQLLAQEELDRICPDRLVTFADRENLPYVECILKEIYRFHPVLPSNLVHTNEYEDVFEGMRIPKGSMVIANIWGMTHDEAMYPSPHIFDPSRYMKDGKVSSDIRDPRSMFFGFGRRHCPGKFLADAQIFITVANILKLFTIGPPSAKPGFTLDQVKYTSGISSQPEMFDCEISPRNGQVKELIRAALELV